MAEFNSVTLAGTDFVKAATIEQVHNSAGGSFYITGGSVYYNLQYPIPQGRGKPVIWTQFEWTPDRLLPTGPGDIPPGVMGIRFKNAAASAPATVTAAIADPGQPVLGVSSPASVTSVSSGVIIQHNGTVIATEPTIDFEDNGSALFAVADDPANTRVQVTAGLRYFSGIIPAAGTTPTAGSGFTYTHGSTGVYVFTITGGGPNTYTAFVETQTVSGFVRVAPGTSGFTVSTFSTGSVATDIAFSFVAFRVV